MNDFFELTSKLLDPVTVQVGDVWAFEDDEARETFFILAVDDSVATVCKSQYGHNHLYHMFFRDFESKHMKLVFRDAKYPPYTYQFAVGLHSICPH